MPEYLSPGVYIEELPPQLQAIEGVSTSTAGFVGMTQRGPTPGFPLPFTPQPTDSQVVTLVPDPTPVLVTSFADFTRQFGSPLPLPDPTNNSYLGYAVQAFFANGGLRAYISRVLAADARYSAVRVYQGTVLLLTSQTKATDTILNLNSLRLVGTGTKALILFSRTTGQQVAQVNVTSYNSANKTVTLDAPINQVLTVSDTYILPAGVTFSAANGPTFWAQNPGDWSQSLTVSIAPSDRNAFGVLAGGAATAQTVVVNSTNSFYVGAIIEIDRGPTFTLGTQRTYHEVTAILPGSTLQLGGPVATQFPGTSMVRVCEIDISISDPTAAVTTSETYPGLTWNPHPAASARHYATVINANSNLVFVEPPGVGAPAIPGSPGTPTATGTVVLTGSEAPGITSQPTTDDGASVSPLSELGPATTAAIAAVAEAVSDAATVLSAANAITAAMLPLQPTNARSSSPFKMPQRPRRRPHRMRSWPPLPSPPAEGPAKSTLRQQMPQPKQLRPPRRRTMP